MRGGHPWHLNGTLEHTTVSSNKKPPHLDSEAAIRISTNALTRSSEYPPKPRQIDISSTARGSFSGFQSVAIAFLAGAEWKGKNVSGARELQVLL